MRWKISPKRDDWTTALTDALTTTYIGVDRVTAVRPAPSGLAAEDWLTERRGASALEMLSIGLRKKIQLSLAKSVEDSRQLDNAFIDWAIQASTQDSGSISLEVLQDKAQTLSGLQRRYMACGVIDRTPTRPITTDLNDTQRRLLNVHIETEMSKLRLMSSLQLRLELLLELVNSKLQSKQLTVHREEGFRVTTARGKTIPLHQLSSGEQHEIALLYRLLFQTPAKTLVMIDEPEISLHTVWQAQFIDDLLKIAGVTQCQYIIATHSPDLVGNHLDKTVGLSG